MRILPLHVHQKIKEFDPSIEVLFNSRINRWVVCQVLPQPVPVTDSLRGISLVGDSSHSRLKVLFICENGDMPIHGDPNGRCVALEPNLWIIPFLIENYPTKREKIDKDAPWGDAYHREAKAREEAVDRERRSYFREGAADVAKDIWTYSSDVGKSKKHILISSK